MQPLTFTLILRNGTRLALTIDSAYVNAALLILYRNGLIAGYIIRPK